MIKLTDIFRAINETLLASFEDIRAYKERIHKQKRPDMSVEIISFTTSPHSRFIINKSIDLDIIYFSKNNTVGEALKIADRLMSALSMGLTVRVYDEKNLVDKRTLHCLKAPEYKLVDQDLHFLVRFDFADELEPYYLADDETMKAHNQAIEPRKEDEEKRPDQAKKRPADTRDFALDLGFKTDQAKKDYEEEKIKLMDSLKLEYEFMED